MIFEVLRERERERKDKPRIIYMANFFLKNER
jgi:hypothetical protein